MKRKYAALVISSLFVLVMLGSAWAQSDEENNLRSWRPIAPPRR